MIPFPFQAGGFGSSLPVASGDTDPNFANVVALLHMDGTNGSTTITDSSGTPKTFTANNGAAISTAQSKFGGASAFFDSVNDYIEAPDNADWDFGSGDFTLEAWIRTATVAAGQGVIISRQEAGTAYVLQLRRNANALEFISRDSDGTDLFSLSSGAALTVGTWHHVAASRNGSTLKLFVDGVEKNSGTIANDLFCARPLTVGALNNGSVNGFFSGYIDDVRITKGVARYTANFTPPTAAFPNS